MGTPGECSAPVILCMQDSTGQEVSLNVEPGDDFHSFLRKAKELLGFDVDISCITQNQNVSLSENLYDFLINADESQFIQPHTDGATDSVQQLLSIRDQTSNDTVYILEDGTRIKASQIQNDDSPSALDVDKIPFVQYRNSKELMEDKGDAFPRSPDFMKNISISQSPGSRNNSVKTNEGFVNSLPFKPVLSHLNSELISYIYSDASELKTLRKYRQEKVMHNKELSGEKIDDISHLTRSQILNLLKDSPVKTSTFVETEESDKPKHVRKTDPCRQVSKKIAASENNSDGDTVSAADIEKKPDSKCYICNTLVSNEIDEIYLFTKDDQKRYRSSPDKELAVKIICKTCLKKEFTLCLELLNEKTLDFDEYLVIQHNRQYVYKKNTDGVTQKEDVNKYFGYEEINNQVESDGKVSLIVPVMKLEVTETGEIITKPMDEDERTVDVKLQNLKNELMKSLQTKESVCSDKEQAGRNVEEDLDDQVQKFLSKKTDTELKCRFCARVFEELDAAVEHGKEHQLTLEDVFPCPLCEYGYQTFSWLRGHMHSKHRPQRGPLTFRDEAKQELATPSPSSRSEVEGGDDCQSPVARRTRSAASKRKTPPPKKTKDKVKKKKKSKKTRDKSNNASASTENLIRILEGAKKQAGAADDDGIWIVESKYPEGDTSDEPDCSDVVKTHKCSYCNKRFVSVETLARHEARRRHAGSGRPPAAGPVRIVDDVYMPSEEDFLKRAKGRKLLEEQWLDEDDGTLRPRYRGRKKALEPTSDPNLLTCDDCGATFTSKVRLKFHIQFHSPSCKMLTADGEYMCEQCGCEESAFATESELFDHLHFSHGKRSRWICPVSGCHKTFFLRAMLTKHSRAHTDTRRYVCGVCAKRFLDKQTLDEHSVTHLKIKPFQCHLCLKQLTRRSRLRMHLRAHEEHLAPRLVRVCRHCHRAFKNYTDAQEHAAGSECAAARAERAAGAGGETAAGGGGAGEAEAAGGGGAGDGGEAAADSEPPSDYDEDQRGKIDRLFGPENSEELQSMTAEMSRETRRVVRIVEIEKAFRCEYCEDVFYMEGALNAHRARHKGVKNPFTCHICRVSFPTYSRCTTHKTTHGFFKRSVAEVRKEETGAEAAGGAGGAATAAAAPREQAGPSADGIVGYGDFPVVKHFLCEDCGRSYLHWTYLQVHRRMKHPTGDCVYKCADCDLTFPNSWGLAYHKRKMHGPNPPGEDRKPRNPDVKLPCRDCDKIFPNKSALYTHRRKAHKSDRKPYALKGLGLFSCATCGKCYAGRPGLETHLRTHAPGERGGAPYACARCGVAYVTSAHLTRHVLALHAEEASQMCATCGATFVSQGQLSAHVRTHSPRRPHACHVCAHAFRTASMLAEHLRIHTGERPFPCDICGMSFRRSTARRNHRLIHTGERAFACPQCPKRFRIRSDLRTHFRSKHPHQILVLEVKGLNPEPEAVIEQLHLNNVALDRVLEIAKISFPKGSANLMMYPDVTLETLQRAQDEGSSRWSERVMSSLEVYRQDGAAERYVDTYEYPTRRGRGISKRERVPAVGGAAGEAGAACAGALQLQYGDQNTFHVEIKDVAADELTELLGGVLTTDGRGVLLNSGQFVPFDSVLSGQAAPAHAQVDPGHHHQPSYMSSEHVYRGDGDSYAAGPAPSASAGDRHGVTAQYDDGSVYRGPAAEDTYKAPAATEYDFAAGRDAIVFGGAAGFHCGFGEGVGGGEGEGFGFAGGCAGAAGGPRAAEEGYMRAVAEGHAMAGEI